MEKDFVAVNKGLTIKELDGYSYFLYDLFTKQYIRFNQDFFELIKKCDGTRTLEKIVDEISEEKRIPKEKIKSMIENIVDDLKKSEIITLEEHISPRSIRLIKKVSSFPLNTVYWEISEKCNFSCIHCYNKSEFISHNDESMNPYEVVDRLAEAGVIDVLLTGGEPFLADNFKDILKYIISKSIDFGIFSNGSLINEELITLFKELNPKFIAISFDSYQKEIFEKIRGPHYFKVLGNIKIMIQENLPLRINTVIFKGLNDSYQHIKNHIQFLKDIGLKADDISIDEFLPTGAGKNKPFVVSPTCVFGNIKKAYTDVFGSAFIVIQDKSNLVLDSYCGLGINICYLKNNGDIALCPVLSDDEFVVGNLKKQPILEIWENADLFKYFRNKSYLKNTKCEKCDYLNQCVGGCKAKSKIFNNTFNSHDNWMCNYFEKDDTKS